MATGVSQQTVSVDQVATSTTSANLVVIGARGGRIITNDSAAILYIRFGTTAATSTNYTVQIAAGGVYELPQPLYGGQITGILASGTGNARVTSW